MKTKRKIEDYIIENLDGKVDYIYGLSQGGLMTVELLSRGNIKIKRAFLDGVYVAHQGRISGKMSSWMFKKYKHTGKFPIFINISIKLMGDKNGRL